MAGVILMDQFTRNIYRAYFEHGVSREKEASVAKVTSLIVKLGALIFVPLLLGSLVATFFPDTPKFFGSFTGALFTGALPILAVKVDNHPAARGQWGLDAADVVFEDTWGSTTTWANGRFHASFSVVVITWPSQYTLNRVPSSRAASP